MKKFKYCLCVMVGAGLWGCVNIFVNKLAGGGLNSLQIGTLRQLSAAPVFLLAALIKDPGDLKIKARDIPLFLLTGLFSGLMFSYLYFQTIINSQVSVAVVLLYTSPVFVILFSRLLFKERITGKKVLALIMTVLGCVFVSGLLGNGYRIPANAFVTGIGTGMTYAGFTVLTGLCARKYKPTTVTAYTFLAGALFMVPLGNLPGTMQVLRANTDLIFWAVSIGLICSVVANTLFTIGIAHVETGRAAILAASEPLVGTLIGIFLYREGCGVLKALGILLVLGGIILQGMGEKQQTQ